MTNQAVCAGKLCYRQVVMARPIRRICKTCAGDISIFQAGEEAKLQDGHREVGIERMSGEKGRICWICSCSAGGKAA